MFEVLVASGAHLELRSRWMTSSVIMHALVVTLAAVATQAALDAPPVTAPNPAILLSSIPRALSSKSLNPSLSPASDPLPRFTGIHRWSEGKDGAGQ